jgi:hypothetical protein
MSEALKIHKSCHRLHVGPICRMADTQAVFNVYPYHGITPYYEYHWNIIYNVIISRKCSKLRTLRE